MWWTSFKESVSLKNSNYQICVRRDFIFNFNNKEKSWNPKFKNLLPRIALCLPPYCTVPQLKQTCIIYSLPFSPDFLCSFEEKRVRKGMLLKKDGTGQNYHFNVKNEGNVHVVCWLLWKKDLLEECFLLRMFWDLMRLIFTPTGKANF